MAVAATRELHVVNPATLELVGTVAATDPGDVAHLVAGAAALQVSWGETPLDDRAEMLAAVSRALLRRVEAVADIVVAETGKPRVEAFTSELYPALDALAWLRQEAPRLLTSERVDYPLYAQGVRERIRGACRERRALLALALRYRR
jgi:acyl-CoA reductase-like NAD-dependent aldehyde dehydrogenase